jgi:hypothetical protein
MTECISLVGRTSRIRLLHYSRFRLDSSAAVWLMHVAATRAFRTTHACSPEGHNECVADPPFEFLNNVADDQPIKIWSRAQENSGDLGKR